MAYTPFNNAEIAPSEPNKTELWEKAKDNFDDHETRINATEAATQNFPPMGFVISGPGFVADDIKTIRIPFDVTILGARLTVVQSDGSGGSMTVDLQSDNGGPFASILTSTITLASGGGRGATAAAAGIATTDLDSGDLIRLDIDAIMTGSPDGFHVDIQYEAR